MPSKGFFEGEVVRLTGERDRFARKRAEAVAQANRWHAELEKAEAALAESIECVRLREEGARK